MAEPQVKTYRYPLADGRTLVLEGPTEPTEAQVAAVAQAQGVTLKKAGALAEPPPAPAPAPAPGPPEPSMLASLLDRARAAPGVVAETGLGVASGVAKKAGQMAAGAGEMVHQIPGVTALVDKLYGTPGLSEQAFKTARDVTEPTTPEERFGSAATEIASYLYSPSTAGTGALGRMLIPAASGALVTGARTGGDPLAMARTGVAGAAGGAAAQALAPLARLVRSRALRPLADRMTAERAGPDIDTPDWIQKGVEKRRELATLAGQHGITGGKGDIARIEGARPFLQRRLSAIHNELDPSKRSLSHLWSVLTAGSMALPVLAPSPGSLAVALPLMATSLAQKAPGYLAAGVEKGGASLAALARLLAGMSEDTESDPLEQEVLRRQ